MTLALDQANVVNATRGDEQNEFYDKNMLRGRLWHEAVAVRGNALVVVGGLAKAVLGIDPRRSRSTGGVPPKLCLVHRTRCAMCRLGWLAEASASALVCKEATRGVEFRTTSLPGDVLLVTGGRIGDSGAQQGESMHRPLRAPRNWGSLPRTLGSAFAARKVGSGGSLPQLGYSARGCPVDWGLGDPVRLAAALFGSAHGPERRSGHRPWTVSHFERSFEGSSETARSPETRSWCTTKTSTRR